MGVRINRCLLPVGNVKLTEKTKCSACLKETDVEEFLKAGGLCNECSKEIDKILKKDGIDGVRKFWRRKREEAVKRE